MENISECINTIGCIIDELFVDENRLKDFKEQYRKIILKKDDPNFYLSTIGDFSSGKSTLINTMIRRKLLKVAHTATTAVPTYIYRGGGKRLAVKVRCSDETSYNLSSKIGRERFESKYAIELPSQTDKMISLLTCDEALSAQIIDVTIELPEIDTRKNLCIIDTPGINPGAAYAEKHDEITKHILSEKADGIIILFPADQAYTQAFEKFLKDNAEYFMKDAIFVVTMLDRIDEEERDDVIAFVKTNLRNNFKLRDPQVLSCCASLALKDDFWAESFKKFESSLMDKLAQNRERIITQKLIKLSTELLNSIDSEVSLQKGKLEKKLAVLENRSVPNLLSVLSRMQENAVEELAGIQDAHDTAIKNAQPDVVSGIMKRVNINLNACDSRAQITKYVDLALVSDIEDVCTDICNISVNYTERLNETLKCTTSAITDELRVYYGEIESTLSEHTEISVSDREITLEDSFTTLRKSIIGRESAINDAVTLTGVGAAAVLMALLGPVGLAVGVAGVIGGDKLFLSSTRDKVRTSVYEKIFELSKATTDELTGRMEKDFLAAQEILQGKKNELIAQYQPVYEEIKKQVAAEKQQLECKIKLSDDTQEKVKAVLKQLEKI